MAGPVPPQPARDKGSLAAVPSSSKRHLTITCGRDGSVLTPFCCLCQQRQSVPGDERW